MASGTIKALAPLSSYPIVLGFSVDPSDWTRSTVTSLHSYYRYFCKVIDASEFVNPDGTTGVKNDAQVFMNGNFEILEGTFFINRESNGDLYVNVAQDYPVADTLSGDIIVFVPSALV